MLLYIAMMSLLPVAILNNVDYIDPTGRCVFCTTAAERHKVVFQMVCYYILLTTSVVNSVTILYVWVCRDHVMQTEL